MRPPDRPPPENENRRPRAGSGDLEKRNGNDAFNIKTSGGAQARARRPRMRLISFKPLVKGSLKGFANIELPCGLLIDDCPVLVNGDGRAWASLPSKPSIGNDSRQIEVSGKKQYNAFLKWRDRDLSDGFSAALVALVRQHHPGALDGHGVAS